MKGALSIPPSRDLPPSRLAQRREHLLSEIAQPPSRRPLPRRGLLALAAAALIVVVGTASAIGGVRAFFLDQGFIGLPPVGATPSTPERGELVLQWLGRSKTRARGPLSAPLVRAWVYADGRVIWSEESSMSSRPVPEGANELTSGYLERRLTPEGVELLRSQVIGLLEGSRTPLETVPSEDDPRYHFGLEVRDGDRLVRPRDPEGATAVDGRLGERWATTPEQLAALEKIDALLTDTASVLPPSAWAVRDVRAYVPSHYAVCIDTAPPKDASQLLSLLPTRAADLLRDKSRTSSEADLLTNVDQVPGHMVVIGRSVTYCSKLTTEEAREVNDALSGLDHDPNFHGVVLAYRVAEAVNNLNPTSIWFEPYFPHGQVTCSSCG
jgi:hypothetical protein